MEMREGPRYPVRSVDHALRAATLLQQEGPLSVTELGQRLNVSVSTAHRLVQMLAYRDFARQLPDRTYVAGPSLAQVPLTPAPARELRGLAIPHLVRLSLALGESTNLMVLTNREARFVHTVESNRILRVGDRAGRALPAHQTSGGKALLARLAADQLAALYVDWLPPELTKLRRTLSLVRKRGFAINHQETEAGVTALGVAVLNSAGDAVAAVSLAMPTARFDRDRMAHQIAALTQVADDLGGQV